MQPLAAPSAATPALVHRGNPMFARFRAWKERITPHAAYQIMPRFWTPAGFAAAANLSDSLRRASKNWEPSLVGMAWSACRVHLIVAARAADYEHVAKLIHCRALMRDDPDHAEHRGKRVSMILLCDQAPPAVADFARRMRVRILAASESPAAGAAPELRSADA